MNTKPATKIQGPLSKIQGPLSEKMFDDWKPFKTEEKFVYFMLKAFFVLEIFTYLHLHFTLFG